jgi:hypothetical protein
MERDMQRGKTSLHKLERSRIRGLVWCVLLATLLLFATMAFLQQVAHGDSFAGQAEVPPAPQAAVPRSTQAMLRQRPGVRSTAALTLYLPIAVRQWAPWYDYDPYEPNDRIDLAWGPLDSGQEYLAHIWNEFDRSDYYGLTPTTTSPVSVTLTHVPDQCDYDLYAYALEDDTPRLITYSNRVGSADEDLVFVPVPHQEYYVRVYPYIGYSNQGPYHLRAIYR